MPKKTKSQKVSPTFIKHQNDQHVGVISSVKSRVLYGPLPAEEETSDYFNKSNRSDYGRVIDIRIPHGYHEQVKKAWEMYETDRLFRYLISRCVDFAANGFEWEVPVERKINFSEWLKNKVFKIESKEDKERRVWNKWAATINKRVANVLPGIDEINKWIVKHLLLGGMAPLEWEWGTITVDNIDYQMPIKMVIHNSLSIALERPKQTFSNEEMYLKLSLAGKSIAESYKETPLGTGTTITHNPDEWHKIVLMGTAIKPKLEGFAVKYDWTPADNTSLVYGRNVQTGQGLYPSPPFIGLYEILVMRRALTAADLAILDGVINFILDWEIGDNTILQNGQNKEILPNQPRPAKYDSSGSKIEKSTIEMAKEIITSDTRGNVMQLFHPYYFKLNIKTPDTSVLLNTTKYVQSTVEVYQAFGILLSPADKRMDFSGINIQNFEQFVDNIRLNHIRRFWEALTTAIVERNKGKLTAIPNMSFKPLNTKTEAFKMGLLNLIKIGKISTRSLLQAYGLDDKVEIERIAQEISSGEKELTDRQVPVSYVQAKVNPTTKNEPDNNIEQTKKKNKTQISPLEQQGRPNKGTAKEK